MNRVLLEELIEEITVDAYGEQEQLWAFRQAFEDSITMPCEGLMVGEPVSVLKFDYDGNERRGLTAKCRRSDGGKYTVAASDVVITKPRKAAAYIAAYRKWMDSHLTRRKLNLQQKQLALESHSPDARSAGEVVAVKPRNRWTCAPTAITCQEQSSMWDPREHYWGGKSEPIGRWARQIIAHGPRPQFEMEQILPGQDRDDPFSDSVLEANYLKDSGNCRGVYTILMSLCQADLRCLDAHSHLGNLLSDRRPEGAIRHYEAGFRIGELFLGGRLQ